MIIAQISDSHIAAPGKKAYNIASTAENMASCVEHINRLNPQPNLVLFTGDITYSGKITEARRAADILNELCCPFYVTPGNHDIRSTLRSVFKKNGCPAENSGFLNYVVENYDIRMIGLDTTRTNAPGGEICHRRAKWLSEKLKENSEQPTIIFMHHPPVKLGVLETDEDGFIGADLLGEIVAKYSNILSLLCGHIHLAAHVNWRGKTISTAPSMGLQLGLDLTLSRPSEFFLGSPGYQLHYFTPDRNLVTHTIFVNKLDGPYLFEEQ